MDEVEYFVSARGEKLVQNFIDSLEKVTQSKVLRIVLTIRTYGLQSVLSHVKKLSGTPLWEIRILGRDNVRIFYVVHHVGKVMLLHGFVKKKQKTDLREIDKLTLISYVISLLYEKKKILYI